MKSLKMLGLAAIAALGLMAFVGAGTASATVICKTNLNPCPAEWMVSTGTNIVSSLATSATLETSGSTPETLDTCTGGSVSGPTEQTGSSTETVSIKVPKENITWSGCTRTTDTVSGGTLEFHYEGSGKLTVTVKEIQVTVNIGGVSCTYGYGSEYKDLATIDPPEGTRTHATITINTLVPKTEGSFACPKEPRWTASYEVTEPNGGALWGSES
ncbi:MAG: hypothetical protein ACTHNP_09515 [Solirubrobacterales bacterium]